MRATFDNLFNPRSLALIGASSDHNKIGFRFVSNITHQPYKGTLYLVNPKGEVILDRKSIKSIDELPKEVDLVILSIPKKAVFPAIEACIRRSVRFVVVLTAGFKEIGDEGIELEANLKALLRKAETRLIGPNCAGLVNTWAHLHATFEIYPPRGNISFISQSGSLCSAFSSNLAARQQGVSKYISLGNKLDINEADLVEYLGDDPATACISLYLEDISDGRHFWNVASKISLEKPIVVFKSGRTLEGSRATYSHTGAMAGEDSLVEGAFRQMGIIRVSDLTELYDVSAAVSLVGPVKGREIAILSDAGGPGVIATDAAIRSGLALPNPSENTSERLRSFLPDFASVQNPIDMTFTRDVRLYCRCIEELRREGMKAILITIPSHFAVKEDLVSALIEAKDKSKIPIVVAWLSGDEVEDQRRSLWRAGIPSFTDPQRASAVIGKLAWYGQWLMRRKS